MAAHRYWRVRSPDTQDTLGPDILACTALQLRTSIGGSDVATGGTAIADGFYTGYPPSDAFDGNSATFWTTYLVTYPTGGHWIGYDFGSGNDKDIVEIVYTSRSDSIREDPLDLYFEWSDNGSTWTTLQRFPYVPVWTSAESRTFTISGAERYWRVRSTVADVFGVGCSIAELELRSSIGGSDLTTGKVAYASANYSGSQDEAQLGIDNNAATCWAANNSTPTGGHWLAVPLAAGTWIEQVSIQARNDGFVGATPDNLFVEYSDDFGSSWTTYWSVASIAAWTGGLTRTFSNPTPVGRRRQMTVCN